MPRGGAPDTFNLQDGLIPIARVRATGLDQASFESDARIRVGRAPDNDLQVPLRHVSKHHLELQPAEGGARVRDLGSTGGTYSGASRIFDAIVPLPARLTLGGGSDAAITIEDAGSSKEFVPNDPALESLVGRSKAMLELRVRLAKVAASDWDVLLLGETGTGKEIVARLVHDLSRRSQGPFEVVNCAAIPTSLVESELFGANRGAAAEVAADRAGPFERANGGTIFLDEIGELPFGVQAKLFRTLESREVQRLGGARPQRVDVRVVAATNRDLIAEVAANRFREELYHRLVLPLRIPPLRERRDDIPLLVEHFVRLELEMAPPGASLPAGFAEAMTSRDWPGNVRELRNEVRCALSGLPTSGHFASAQRGGLDPEALLSLQRSEALRVFEAWYLQRQLQRHGTKAAAARAAGMERSHFHRRTKEVDAEVDEAD